jgi:hypothetical protein
LLSRLQESLPDEIFLAVGDFEAGKSGRRVMMAVATLVADSDAVEALGFARVAGVSLVRLVAASVVGSVGDAVLSIV